MMRRLYCLSTLIFWLAVAAFWADSQRPPTADGSAAVAAGGRLIPAAELARHKRPGDCWMAIHGGVYDLSSYLPLHPSRPEIIEPWCGKEASEAYDTKTVGRAHSPYAGRLLEKYRLGRLAGEP